MSGEKIILNPKQITDEKTLLTFCRTLSRKLPAPDSDNYRMESELIRNRQCMLA